MQNLFHHVDLDELTDRLHDATEPNAALVTEIMSAACRRFPSIGQRAKTTRIEQLVQCGAWIDVALGLIDLELPQWKVRRIVYDEGEWHCALSRQRELPDWLDQAIEVHHADLALAVLGAFVEARRIATPTSHTSVPSVSTHVDALTEIACSDNYA
jgi:hypothetical protein